MKVVCAFDEGPSIGLGHRRRVESVEHELAAWGVETELLPIGDATITADVVLVDSYRVRADDRERVQAEIVIAIDDIERDLAVDLVIDPHPGADEQAHTSPNRVLAGAAYAIVDPRVRAFAVVPPRRAPRRILVTTGAADADAFGAQVASALADAVADVQVRLVVGEWGNPGTDARVETLFAPDGLAAELAAADLVVTAGGVTMLEACCLGRPTVAFSIADNQSPALAGAAAAGAVLAADRATAAGVASRLAHDYEARMRLATSARALIDGRGSERVASAIASILQPSSRVF